MFRCDRGNFPHCINDFWRRNRDVSGRDSRNKDKFYHETINYNHLENHPYFSFPKLYNELPDDFKLPAVGEKEFAKLVKLYLFDSLEEQLVLLN